MPSKKKRCLEKVSTQGTKKSAKGCLLKKSVHKGRSQVTRDGCLEKKTISKHKGRLPSKKNPYTREGHKEKYTREGCLENTQGKVTREGCLEKSTSHKGSCLAKKLVHTDMG